MYLLDFEVSNNMATTSAGSSWKVECDGADDEACGSGVFFQGIAAEGEDSRARALLVTKEPMRCGVYVELRAGWTLRLEPVAAVHTPGRQRITEAIVDSGVVRVKRTEDQGLRPAVVFTPPMRVGQRDKKKYPETNGFKHRVGWGPMFMATPSVLDVDRNSDWILGAGLMLAIRTDQRGSSLGIGVAYGAERSRMLREDFRPNELAPTDSRGVLQPIFEDRTTGAWMFAVAFSVGNANRPNGEP